MTTYLPRYLSVKLQGALARQFITHIKNHPSKPLKDQTTVNSTPTMRNASFLLSSLLPNIFYPLLVSAQSNTTCTTFSTASPPPNLNITALTYSHNATDNTSISVLECWTINSPFNVPTAGDAPLGAAVASLGGVSGNMSFIVQAPRSVGGYRNSPGPQ